MDLQVKKNLQLHEKLMISTEYGDKQCALSKGFANFSITAQFYFLN